jgi:acyl-CoA reductase-like NAD-dependent aldehyde dehydrogenase
MTTTEAASASNLSTYELYIDGTFRPASDGATDERTNPADGSLVGRYASATEDDVDTAVAAARRAFDDTPWPRSPARQRSAILQKTAELLRAQQADIGRRISLELGKPIRMAVGEVSLTAEVFEYYAALAQDLRGESISQHTSDALGLILHEPVGVVAAITPWNFPLLLLSWKVAPALAAGCTVVAKPSSLTPGSAFDLARVLEEAGLPAGVYNVLSGDGARLGSALTRHHGVDKVGFTGSTAVGRLVLEAAGTNMKKVTLELGGKSPNIVFADANLEQAARGAYWGAFLNTGQACQAGSRLLVQRDVHDQMVDALVEQATKSRVGDPLDPSTMIGPLVDDKQLATVRGYLAAGQDEGAKLLCGGGAPTAEALQGGHYVEPAVFAGVTPDMRIAQEEIFGPVVSVLPFDTAEDAVRIANDSMYGLAAAVWTQDIDTALRTTRALRAGTIWVNAYHDAGLPFVMPMGGYKASGHGRELGREGLSAYLETKSIHIRIAKS